MVCTYLRLYKYYQLRTLHTEIKSGTTYTYPPRLFLYINYTIQYLLLVNMSNYNSNLLDFF